MALMYVKGKINHLPILVNNMNRDACLATEYVIEDGVSPCPHFTEILAPLLFIVVSFEDVSNHYSLKTVNCIPYYFLDAT